jgi:hypothetical protein
MHITKAQRFALEKLRDHGPSVLSIVARSTKQSLLKRGLVEHTNCNPHWFALTDAGLAALDEPTAEDLAAITEEDCEALLHAILTALEKHTSEECRATLMDALVDSHNSEPKPIPDDECVYSWRDEVVAEHLKKGQGSLT